jgi:hypothetical protein
VFIADSDVSKLSLSAATLSMLEARVTVRWPEQARTALDDLHGKLFASVPEAAAVLRSDPRSVRRAIEAGDIPCTRVGPRSLIPVAWLRQAAGLETAASGGAA